MIKDKTLILLVNLGSPNTLTVGSIRKFLRRFLSDKRVVNLPRIFWYPILFLIILPLRAKKLLHQYKKIWLHGKSPLIYYSEKQSIALEQKINNEHIICRHSFCYSEPDIQGVLKKAHSEFNIEKLIVIPLYPQFSSTTTSPVFDQVTKFYQDKYYLPEMHFTHGFFKHKSYINGLANQIKNSWKSNKKGDKLVFSFHSLPQQIIDFGDSYYNECLETVKQTTDLLGLNQDEYTVSFQSKFGRSKWITPSTTNVLIELAKEQQNVDVICPGFVSDCLETLEEIKVTNKELFLNNGGGRYNYIDCLNATPDLIATLHDIILPFVRTDLEEVLCVE